MCYNSGSHAQRGSVGLSHILQQSFSIVLPKLRQFASPGIFAARNFQRHFHGSMNEIIVVLHASYDQVPVNNF